MGAMPVGVINEPYKGGYYNEVATTAVYLNFQQGGFKFKFQQSPLLIENRSLQRTYPSNVM